MKEKKMERRRRREEKVEGSKTEIDEKRKGKGHKIRDMERLHLKRGWQQQKTQKNGLNEKSG